MNWLTGILLFIALFFIVCAILLEGLVYDARERERDKR